MQGECGGDGGRREKREIGFEMKSNGDKILHGSQILKGGEAKFLQKMDMKFMVEKSRSFGSLWMGYAGP